MTSFYTKVQPSGECTCSVRSHDIETSVEKVVNCCGHAVQEYQKDNKNVVISETEMKQSIYIYKCENSTVQIKGKVNAITLGTMAI